MTQTITGLTPNVTYRISGWYKRDQHFGSVNGTASFGVSVDGSLQFSAPSSAGSAFSSFTFDWTVTRDSLTLTLEGERGDDTSWVVDDLSVVGLNVPSWVTDWNSATDIWIDGTGRKTDANTGRPSLLPVNLTAEQPFVRSGDHVTTAAGGHDVLNVVDSGATGATTATLDTYRIPIDSLSGDGRPVLHGAGIASYYQSPDRKRFLGGEPVLDPFTGEWLTYTSSDPVVDLYRKDAAGAPLVLRDAFGNVLYHQNGDKKLHTADEPVYHLNGDVQRWLGGEPTFDENGHQVFTGTHPFLHGPDQAKIENRLTPMYDLVDVDGHRVLQGDRTYAPVWFTFSSLPNGTSWDLHSFADPAQPALQFTYDLGSGDQVTLTVYDGTRIFDLVQGTDFTVTGNTITLLHAVPLFGSSATVKVAIATPGNHLASDVKYYFGIDSATAQAAAGGVTTIFGMPNLNPPTTTVETLDEVFELYEAKAIVDWNHNPAAHAFRALVTR